MRFAYLLIAITLISACTSERPDRPSYGKGGTLDGKPEPVIGEETLGENVPPAIDPITGKPIVKDDLTLNIVDSRLTVRINTVEVLVNKLKIVSGLDEASDAVKLARKATQSLGSYDFAQGVLPENKWTLDKMGTWFKVVDLTCRDTKLLTKIQAAGGEKLFLESAYGRDMLDDETAMLKDLKLTGARRARVLCTAILASGEFVSL